MSGKEMLESQFQITGMTCAACSTRVEKGLNKMDGVERAHVNLALEKATVQYNAGLNPDAIPQKIRDLGYEVVTEKAELILNWYDLCIMFFKN